MTNDTTTLNGSLLEMKDQLISELEDKGVTASYDPATGLLGLIARIGDIDRNSYHIEFNSSSYEASGGSATISCTLQENYAVKSGATVTFTGSDSSSYTGITNSSGVASVTVSGLSSDTSFTCSYSNVTDTCTITVPSVLIGTSISEISLDSSFMIQWTVLLKDSNNTPLANKPLKFYFDGVLDTSMPFNTDANGQCFYANYDYFDGTHTIKAVFEGDSSYDASQLEETVTIGF